MSDEQTATIVEIKQLTPQVREMTLQPEGDTLIGFRPGQWLSTHLPVGEKPPLVRAYSLANAPRSDGGLVLCFDRVAGGLGSEYLWNRSAGEVLRFSGPTGNFLLPDGDAPLVLVARYTGIVPFRAMLQAIERGDAVRRPVHLIYGLPDERELLYHDEFAALAERAGDWFDYYPVHLTESDEIAALTRHAGDWPPFVPMVCGTRNFTFPTRAHLMATFGFDRKQVKIENYNGPSVAAAASVPP